MFSVSLALVSCKGESKPHGGHWSYEGETGPEKWGELSTDFEACKIGENQSPIDITGASAADLPALQLNYNPTNYEIVNNGHTIQVNLKDAGKLVIGEDSYSLLQFHFHHPSEEAVDGERFPLVAHFVHKADDGELAVIGLLFSEGDKSIEAFQDDIADRYADKPSAINPDEPAEVKFDSLARKLEAKIEEVKAAGFTFVEF